MRKEANKISLEHCKQKNTFTSQFPGTPSIFFTGSFPRRIAVQFSTKILCPADRVARPWARHLSRRTHDWTTAADKWWHAVSPSITGHIFFSPPKLTNSIFFSPSLSWTTPELTPSARPQNGRRHRLGFGTLSLKIQSFVTHSPERLASLWTEHISST